MAPCVSLKSRKKPRVSTTPTRSRYLRGYSAETGRGGGAATTWIFRGSRRRRGHDMDISRVAAAPRPRRGYSVEAATTELGSLRQKTRSRVRRDVVLRAHDACGGSRRRRGGAPTFCAGARTEAAVVGLAPAAEAREPDRDRKIRDAELVPHVTNEVHKVRLVIRGAGLVAAVVPALVPREARDLGRVGGVVLRGYSVEAGRGDAAAATWILFRGGGDGREQ